ncbi:MAG: hypothetical protein ACYSWU_02240 [Planctomycetota bacterium]|jgi:hypothetical protein
MNADPTDNGNQSQADERGNRPPLWELWLLGAYFVVLNVSLLCMLLKVWPGVLPLPEGTEGLSLFGAVLTLNLQPEIQYLLIVLLVGALGSSVHLTGSFVYYVGRSRFRPKWTMWYLLRPFVGAILAMVVYFVFRAGFLAGSGGVNAVNLFGIAGVAGLTGMFSKQAVNQLTEVYNSFFKIDPERDPDRYDRLDD